MLTGLSLLCLSFVAVAEETTQSEKVAAPVVSASTPNLVIKTTEKVETDLQATKQTLTKDALKRKKQQIKKSKEKIQTAKQSRKLHLASIEVSGVDEELAKNIELHMPVTVPECNADRGEVKQFFSTVKKQLRKASRALGYYDTEFRSGGKIEKGCWKLRLKITQGKPTKIISQKISIVGEGAKLPIFKKILSEKPYEKGDVLNHKLYTDYKTRMTDAAQALGFFDAEFETHTIRVDALAHKAALDLKFNTGPRYRYGVVTIEQDVLDDSTINHYLLLKTGKPFKAEDLLQQQQLLQRSGYFNTINIAVKHEQATNGRVPISIKLTRKKRNAYKLKLGYGSETGPRVAVEMNRRWTGSSGKALKALTRVSKNDQVVSLFLLNPQEKPEDDTLVYNIDFKREIKPDSISKNIKVGGKFNRKRDSGWVQTASLGLLLDITTPEGEDDQFSKYILFGVGLEKTKADNLLFPLDGWRVKYSANLASKALLSNQDVLQAKVSAKRIKELGEGRFLGRFEIASTLVNNYDDLPQGLRYYSGGQNSVRGYKFSSLGDKVDRLVDGEIKTVNIGGRNLLNLSFEYQYPINEEWSVAAFTDIGNAFDDWGDYELKVGVGFGARWKSPIGPVRIDLGFPTDSPEDNSEDNYKQPRLYLGIGSDL